MLQPTNQNLPTKNVCYMYTATEFLRILKCVFILVVGLIYNTIPFRRHTCDENVHTMKSHSESIVTSNIKPNNPCRLYRELSLLAV